MPLASLVVPAFNVETTVAETLRSLLAQSFRDFEVLVIDDGSTDRTQAVVAPFLEDCRVRYVKQANRGLAGARNRGIEEARAPYVGFCDADDLWAPDKLSRHIAHLESNPRLGLSYSGSAMIDENSRPIGINQSPALKRIDSAHILKRNPVGNGSAAVLRRAALQEIAFYPLGADRRASYFDETFRQSEDIECWLRLSLTTDWDIEGIPGHLTLYRVVGDGLSAQTERQLASWENVINKLRPLHPRFFAQHEGAARAYQYRYLARRAVSSGRGIDAMRYLRLSWAQSAEPLWAEPRKTLITWAAAGVLGIFKANPMTAVRMLSRPADLTKGKDFQ
ncbi:MAG: glycosyltransferase family 2 protein [Cognatishimia sp.]